jgi:hypothetical protein
MKLYSRKATNHVLELIEDGMLDPMQVVQACLSYMSEDDVAEMAEANEFFEFETDEETEEE